MLYIAALGNGMARRYIAAALHSGDSRGRAAHSKGRARRGVAEAYRGIAIRSKARQHIGTKNYYDGSLKGGKMALQTWRPSEQQEQDTEKWLAIVRTAIQELLENRDFNSLSRIEKKTIGDLAKEQANADCPIIGHANRIRNAQHIGGILNPPATNELEKLGAYVEHRYARVWQNLRYQFRKTPSAQETRRPKRCADSVQKNDTSKTGAYRLACIEAEKRNSILPPDFLVATLLDISTSHPSAARKWLSNIAICPVTGKMGHWVFEKAPYPGCNKSPSGYSPSFVLAPEPEPEPKNLPDNVSKFAERLASFTPEELSKLEALFAGMS